MKIKINGEEEIVEKFAEKPVLNQNEMKQIGSNFENDLEGILKTNILFNQISYEYYRIK